MRLFVEKVFDSFVCGDQFVYTDEQWNDLLGTADTLKFFVIVNLESGTAPGLTLWVEDSNDARHWFSLNPGQPEIGGMGLNPGENVWSGDAGLGSINERALGAYVRICMQLAGGDNRAQIRVIVCGRGDHSGDVRVPFTPRP